MSKTYLKMICVSNIKWIIKYTKNAGSYWIYFLEHFCKKCNVNLDVLLYAHFYPSDILCKKKVPQFYMTALKHWSESIKTDISKSTFLWYNKYLRVGGKSIFYKEFYDVGIKYVQDLFENTYVIPFRKWIDKGLGQHNWLRWKGLICAIKSNWNLRYAMSKKVQVISTDQLFIGKSALLECT